MAINYLNSLDLNKNEILQGVIENQPNDAAAGASPVEGQLYFNTTNHVLMQYNGTSWEESGGGVESIDLLPSTYVSLADTGTTAVPELTASLSAVDGTAVAATKFLSKDNTWDVPVVDNYISWDLEDSLGNVQSVESGTRVIAIGQTKINVQISPGVVSQFDISHDLQTQTDSTSAASPAAGATFTVVDSVTRDTTGHATGLNVKTITLPTDTNTQETYTLPVSAGTAVAGYSVADIDLTAAGESTGIKSKVTIAGKDSNIAITETTGNNGIVNIALTTDVVIDDTLTVGGDISQTSGGNENVFASELNMSSQKITNVLDPTSAQDAATKQYVDDATVGGLIYQGGYNASTNVPVLDSRGTQIAVEKGWTYTVTADGTFYGEIVRAGDVLIAEVDLASGAGALTNWTTVQNNIDLASSIQVGIGNVIAATDDEMLGIDVTYASGTAEVGLAIADLTAVTTTQNASLIPIFDEDDAANRKISVGNLFLAANSGTSKAYTITDTAVITYPFTLTAATINDTIIQLIDTVTNDTVYADVNRTSVTTATITFSATPTNSVRVLVQKIG